MKPIKSTILHAMLLTLCFLTVAAQLSCAQKAPVLAAAEPAKAPTSPASTSTAVDSTELHKYSPSELGLSIELPGEPTLVALPPENADQEINPAKAYSYQNEHLAVLVFRYTSKTLPLSLSALRNFGAGFLDSASKKPGISDAKNEVKPGNDSTALLLSTYTQGSVMIDTRAFVQTSDDGLWLIMTRFAQADEPSRALSLRIIQSVKLD